MQKNSVELIGFLGKDAEVKQSNNSNFTLLSVATKESWKNKETGEWQSRTEWHQVLAAGKVGEYTATLQKSAHVQIEGTLRSKPYQVEVKGSTSKKPIYQTITTWYIRAEVIRRPRPQHQCFPRRYAGQRNAGRVRSQPRYRGLLLRDLY